jgi:hypothetical protein
MNLSIDATRDSDAVTLQTFLNVTSETSAVAAASPLVLWQVVQALARTCVGLLNPPSSQMRDPLQASRIDIQNNLLAETVQRLSTVELIIEQMHRSVLQNKKESDANTEKAAHLAQNVERAHIKLSSQVVDIQRDLERLQRGVERHAAYVDEILDASAVQLRLVEAQILKPATSMKTPPLDCASSSLQSRSTFGLAVHQTAFGVEVVSVVHASLAESCGLIQRDLILSIAGQSISSVAEVGMILNKIMEKRATSTSSDTLVIEIFRNERLHSVPCVVAAIPK